MKEVLNEIAMPIENLGVETEFLENEPLVEILGDVKEFSYNKRWFNEGPRIPDIG